MPSQRLLLAFSLLAVTPFAAARDGASLYQSQCAACHGPAAQGQAALAAPPLAGQQAAYLVRQLQAFRAGWRGTSDGPGATMRAVAQALPDEASLQAVARYLAAQRLPTAPTAPTAAPATLMAGKGLFGVCVGCHGGQGEGTPALGAPRLHHLPAPYLEAQLRAYRDGARGSHDADTAGRQMRQVTLDALPDDASVQQVVAYLVTLRPRAGR